MKKAVIESAVRSIDKIHLHHVSEINSEVYSICQLENGFLLLSLGNGEVIFYRKENFEQPFYRLYVDSFPITNIIKLSSGYISCSSNRPSLFILAPHHQIKNEYEIKAKANLKTFSHSINKILELPDGTILTGDNAYISIWSFKSEKNLEILKEKKINSPISDVLLLPKKIMVCSLPLKQSLIFIDYSSSKLNQTYEINNIKFVNSLEFNNILCLLSNDMIFVGGCPGNIYLIDLKHKEFVANIKLSQSEEIITTVYEMINSNLLCGVSVLMQDPLTNSILVSSDIIQYDYKPHSNYFRAKNSFQNVHNGIIRTIKEIINHKDMKEVVSISFDGNMKIWN